MRRLTLHELEIATNYFNETHYLGKGSFGSVYYGILDDENRVAIKCASVHNTQGQQQFRNELTLLSRLHHRHLVALKGFCDEDGLQVRYSPSKMLFQISVVSYCSEVYTSI